MSDPTGGAPATVPSEAAANEAAVKLVEKFFSEAPADDAAPPPAAPPPAPEVPKAAPGESFAEVIRRAREDRERAHAHETESRDSKSKLAEAMAEIDRLKKGDDPLGDPIGWSRGRKMTREQQALFAQTLLYDIVPEKTPPDLRVKLLEAKLERDRAADAEARTKAEAESRTRAEQEQLNYYAAAVKAAVVAAEPGSNPATAIWFGDDTDSRVRSLLATANNIAAAAKNSGRSADLTPANVARVLEQEIDTRLRAIDTRRGAPPKNEQPKIPPEQPKPQGQGTTTSTKGLTSGGPRPPAKSDAERAARAAEVMFASR